MNVLLNESRIMNQESRQRRGSPKAARVLAGETSQKIDQEVLLKGWVRTRRDHGKLIFLDLRDRSGVVQLVVNPQVSEGAHKVSQELRPEYVIEVRGEVKKRPENTINKDLPTGEVEVEVKGLTILSKAETLPFDMGGEELNLELPTLLDNRTLTLRHPKISAIFKVQKTIASAFRKTLKEEGFTEIFVPTIVATATEGGAEVFSVDYYKHKAYLAQSPQLYKQMMVGIFERVFTIAHAYRAEPSVTTRHLSEYISLDAEMGFIDSYTDLMDMAEKVVKEMFRQVSENHQQELSLFGASVPPHKNRFPRLKMREAQKIIFKRTKRDHRSEPDLDPADEKEICQWALEESGVPFVFITHYPTKKRPFYTMPDPRDPEYTLGFDLLGINEEWVTGGQRINNYEMLLSNIKKWGNKPEQFGLYLQAFKYGMPPEGGFAMGLERITKDLLGLINVREASLYPRDMERVDERLQKTKKEK
ncbi:MAG: aspartate--tRNA(Asn) ligase [Candidatus Levybacteria bacterium]|nr:aspartate--tRNA(Asn) ligase [Candidatus Levybacteria bacterium]